MYIYIVLSYTGSIPSKLIKKVTKQPYAHVSISKDEKLNNMYSFGRKYTYFPWYGGFIKEDISSGLFKRMKSSKIAIYKVRASESSFLMVDNLISEFSETSDRYFYDFKGALGVYLKRDMFRENGYVCSSFVNEILTKSGIDTNKSSWEIEPIEFSKIKDAELIYEGLAANYRAMNH